MGDLLTLYWNDVRTSSFKAPYLEGISKPELRPGIMALIFLVGLYFWTQKLAKEEAKDTLAGDGSFISFTYDNKPV